MSALGSLTLKHVEAGNQDNVTSFIKEANSCKDNQVYLCE